MGDGGALAESLGPEAWIPNDGRFYRLCVLQQLYFVMGFSLIHNKACNAG